MKEFIEGVKNMFKLFFYLAISGVCIYLYGWFCIILFGVMGWWCLLILVPLTPILLFSGLFTLAEMENSGSSPDSVSDDKMERNFFGLAKPREGTEAHRVQEEVKKRKKIAKEKGVESLISKSYSDIIESGPYTYSSPLINEVRKKEMETDDKYGDVQITEFTLKDTEYKFTFQERSFMVPDGHAHHALLELFKIKEDKKVLAINLSEDGYSSWKPFGIDAFIDGEWIDHFRELNKRFDDDKRKDELERAEDSEKTERLKRNFGIN